MHDWTAGYVADVGYTYGYYPELNPLRASLAFLYAGLVPPSQGVHCELGFGQGLSVNIHACASAASWHACDFNPSQAGFAREVAGASGAQAHLTDEAFADFCQRADLPEFDSIGLHGIWSWINDANRAVIVDFVRRKLKVGGVLYISYNTQPGWAAMVPMRDLMTAHAQMMSAPAQGIGQRIEDALAFASKLLATKPRFAQANPQIAERIGRIKDQNRNYVAHEYFNQDWLPMSFSSMAQCLAPAKLDFACSANYSDHIDPLNLSADQQALLRGIPDTTFRETVRDVVVNQSFRKDYWVKGLRTLGPLERAEALRKQRVVLLQARAAVPLKLNGAIGEVNMQPGVYNPILDQLADNLPRTIGQLEQAVKAHGIGLAQMLEAVMVLMGAGSLAPAQDEAAIAQCKPAADRFNAYVLDKAQTGDNLHHLACPVTGGGVPVGRPQLLCLLAIKKGLTKPEDWAQFIWKALQLQGQKLNKDGKVLESAQENLAELQTQAQAFASSALPVLKALQIA